MTRIAINGFGRIGRSVLLERDSGPEVVAVDDLTEDSPSVRLWGEA